MSGKEPLGKLLCKAIDGLTDELTENELEEDAVIRNFRITDSVGKNYKIKTSRIKTIVPKKPKIGTIKIHSSKKTKNWSYKI